MKLVCYTVAAVLSCLPALAQVPTTANAADPFKSLAFLEGTWDANVQGNAAIKLAGRYTFNRELDGHILARHATNDPGCKAPTSFDCSHSDLLYVFQDVPGTALKADYFDNEGHVIHYEVSTPTPTSVVFLSGARARAAVSAQL